MSRDRFQTILRYLHVADDNNTKDPLRKIRPFVNILPHSKISTIREKNLDEGTYRNVDSKVGKVLLLMTQTSLTSGVSNCIRCVIQ